MRAFFVTVAVAERPNSAAAFGAEQFVSFRNVPTFAEHENEAPDGRVLRFGAAELQAIVDRCNERIEETGDYAVVCVGHTPTPEQKAAGAQPPKVVGYAGPFRLGRMVGKSGKVRYCILADYHVYRDCVDEVRQNPRRSVELNLGDSYGDMYLDPIALLGADVPRLDMGLLYSKQEQVLRYSAMAPGSMNAFIPDDTHYSAEPAEGGEMENVKEIAELVTQAVMELPAMKWVESQMAKESGGAPGAPLPLDTVEPDGGLTAADAPAPAPAPAPSPAPEAEPAAEPVPPTPEPVQSPAEKEKMQRYAAMDELSDDEIDQYMAKRRGKVAQYARSGETMQYAAKLAKLEKDLAAERGARVDTMRANQLAQLQAEGVQLDVAEEMQRLCYSKVTDDEFNSQVKMIRTRYQRLPVQDLPTGVGNVIDPHVQQSREASAAASTEATRICLQYKKNGKTLDYATVLHDVLKGDGAKYQP